MIILVDDDQIWLTKIIQQKQDFFGNPVLKLLVN